MNIILFKDWLIKNKTSLKVASDIASRLNKLNNALIHCKKTTSIPIEYKKDKCQYLLSCFYNNGINENMAKYGILTLPLGKGSIHTYKLALNKYIKFKQATD